MVPEASGLAARRAADEAAGAEAAAGGRSGSVELRAAQHELETQERRAADATRALRDAQAAVRRLDDRATMAGKALRGLEREAATAAQRLHALPRPRAGRRPPDRRPVGAGRRQGRRRPRMSWERHGRVLARDRGRTRRRAAGRRRPPPADALDHAEQAATAARVAGAAVGERRRLLDRRLAELRAQAAAEVEASQRRARPRAARLDGARRAGLAATAGASALARLERSLAQAAAERDRLAATLQAGREGLAAAAAGRRQASAALDEHHAVTQLRRGQGRGPSFRAEELGKRIVEEFAIDPDEAMTQYLPGEARLAELPEADPRRQPSTELRRVATALDRRKVTLGLGRATCSPSRSSRPWRSIFPSGELQDEVELPGTC